MKPFLQLLAEACLNRDAASLTDICFVFPSRRAARFFHEYLGSVAPVKDFFIMPEAISMADFCALFTRMARASHLEELCLLYNAYSRLSDEIPDFDRFRFWGEMILNDFADADRYLADPAKLFSNLKNYKEIQSDYLSDEQREIINRYWPDLLEPKIMSNDFWRHFTTPDGSTDTTRGKFMKLWEILSELYERFNEAMTAAGLITSGRIYRNAADEIERRGIAGLPYRRFVFAGFGMLSTSEIKIFRRLSKLDVAEFYWDCNTPLLEMTGGRGLNAVRKYASEFGGPMTLSAFDSDVSAVPDISVTGVPSVSGQANLIGLQLEAWAKDGTVSNPADAVDTAVVLPDESLFVALAHHIPPEYEHPNVSLRLPLKLTPVAGLMKALVSMQLRSRLIKGEYRFFHEDVVRTLSNPLIRIVDNDACNAIIREISKRHIYTLTADTLKADFPRMPELFHPLKSEKGYGEALDYLRGVASSLRQSLDVEANRSRRIDVSFLKGYIDAVNAVEATLAAHAVSVGSVTAIQLVERTVASMSLRFEGHPVEGLQICGFDDARGLDFRNIVIASMNERIVPQRSRLRTFIPENIRRGYGLPTTDFIEAGKSYEFFRLLARASKVMMYYDSRTARVGSNEMSRYIAQLFYLSNVKNISHHSASFTSTSFETPDLEVTKTEEVMRKLNRYRHSDIPGETQSNMSASSINQYIHCPMSFYLKYVEGVNIEEETADYMDSSTYGLVVHSVMENIYKNFRRDPKNRTEEVPVTTEMLLQTARNTAYIDRLITAAINRHHNHKPENDLTPLFGETRVLGMLIRSFVERLLQEETKLTPFSFVDAEMRTPLIHEVNPGLKVNAVMIIDRVDRMADGHLRFVDYKTGNDPLKFGSIRELVAPDRSGKHPKAIVQLLFYANLYKKAFGYDGAIQPYLYLLKSIFTDGLRPVYFGKDIVDDYRTVNDEFMAALNGVIAEIFNPEVPFKRAASPKACEYCTFKSVCGR